MQQAGVITSSFFSSIARVFALLVLGQVVFKAVETLGE